MAHTKAFSAEEGIVLFDHKDLTLSVELILKGDPRAPFFYWANCWLGSIERLTVKSMEGKK